MALNSLLCAHVPLRNCSLTRIVGSKYGRTPKKLQQKVSQLILVGFSVLYDILKVYQSRTPGKVFFQNGVQDGR